MDSLDQVLRERVDELTGSRRARQPLLSTTGTQAAIAELIARSDRLEKALGEMALQVEALTAAREGGALARDTRASDR